MNICIVTGGNFGPQLGGVASVCYNLSQELLKSGEHQIFSLSLHHNPAVQVAGITYETLQQPRSRESVEKTRNFFIRENIQIVWIHTPTPELCRLLHESAKGCSVRIVSIYHSSPYSTLLELRDRLALALHRLIHGKNFIELPFCILKYPFSWLRAKNKTQKLLQSMTDYSDAVCVLSEHYISEFLHFIRGTPPHVRAITNPLQKPERACNIPQKKNQVIISSRLEWKNKRLDRALKIWKKIEDCISGWELIILGNGAAYGDYVELACKLQCKHVRFEGMVKPDAYYEDAKIILMTSSFEGLPMSLLEAQQYGCVPIAYESFSALSDIITDGTTGYKVAPYNARQFTEKLLYLITHEEEREKMGINCMRNANNFQVSVIAKKWLQLFEELLRQRQ